jgi:ParB-like chromosome segregation protein Spo0J
VPNRNKTPPKEPISWPADRVERWPVAKLAPDARNARTHSEAQIAQIAASIEEWGWTIPVLVDEAGGIIAGHGRILAAQRLGLEDVPVMVATGWSDAKKRAYMLADNKLTLNAEWDLDRLAIELSELSTPDFDLSLIGFNEGELGALLHGPTDPDQEWEGMPEFRHEDKTAFKSLTVHFHDQKAVDDFAAIVGQTITPKTRFMWFPEPVIETFVDKKYKAA